MPIAVNEKEIEPKSKLNNQEINISHNGRKQKMKITWKITQINSLSLFLKKTKFESKSTLFRLSLQKEQKSSYLVKIGVSFQIWSKKNIR